MSRERPIYAFEGFRMDAGHRTLFRADGTPVPLPPKVFDVLLYLVEHPGELLNKRALLDAVWPDVVVEENNLNQAISVLRRTLGESPADHRFIVTDPGRGYRFVAAVSVIVANSSEASARRSGSPGKPAAGARARRRGAVAVTLGILLVVAAVFGYVRQNLDAVSPSSVAVLPFDDLSPNPENAFLGAGMHAEIISQLTQLRGLKVIGRDAVLGFADSRPSYAEIAAALNVETILVGTFRYIDDQIRVNVQLVDPRTGANLWAADYNRDFADVFGVQSDIALNVASRLNAELSAAERQRVSSRPTASMEAYKAYWRAFELVDFGTRSDALSTLERAIQLDPEFALAHAHCALLYSRSLIDWGDEPAVPLELEELERRVIAHARRALELDPEVAIAYVALGELHMHRWRWTEAASAFAAAYTINPNDSLVLGHYSQFNTFRGHYAEAVPMAERLLELDPPSPDSEARGTGSLYYVWLAHVYSGDVGAALVALNEHLGLHPRQLPARLNLGFVEARRGNLDAARDAFHNVRNAQASARSATATANLAYGYSRIGDADEAVRLFEDVERMAEQQSVAAGTWAMAYLAVGDTRRSAEWLDEALENVERQEPAPGWFSLMIMKHNLTGDPILEQARYVERRERIRGI